jgi:hypothetical protein
VSEEQTQMRRRIDETGRKRDEAIAYIEERVNAGLRDGLGGRVLVELIRGEGGYIKRLRVLDEDIRDDDPEAVERWRKC